MRKTQEACQAKQSAASRQQSARNVTFAHSSRNHRHVVADAGQWDSMQIRAAFGDDPGERAKLLSHCGIGELIEDAAVVEHRSGIVWIRLLPGGEIDELVLRISIDLGRLQI